MIRIYGQSFAWQSLAACILLGLGGALLARWAGTPLPWLFGPVVCVGAAAILGLKAGGDVLRFPGKVRQLFVPVIGLSIGGSFTQEVVAGVAEWWPSLLALLVYVPLVHYVCYLYCRRYGGLDAPTAWYGSMPGGFVEAITMGERDGANEGVLAAMQFLRLIICILLIPLGLSIIEGQTVGSASGVSLPGADIPLTLKDAAVLIACGVVGYIIGTRSGMPAGQITGPIVLSAAAHLSGVLEGQPPVWTIRMTQLVIGITLGVRFAGMRHRDLLRALRLSATMVAGVLAAATLVALVLGPLVGESVEAVVLSFAPGGLVEMSLVALSLNISAVYVTAHHVLRIVVAVIVGRAGFAIVKRREQG
ncbi:AbrB family transcriptional regulator [Oceanicella sp. SM1341]|uniref:AbrB family transcriptional regulator n=1 Tax=Oceanicella sp. SM1341 TaxID=1548889 RepID=UPI000E536752|nr:AbrB family transcriptional regulator [Oceanicella sp. SM1341]